MSTITVFVCESQPVVVEGLRCVLERAGEFDLVGHASSSVESIPAMVELRPQVALLDQAGGLKAVFRFLTDLRAATPSTHPVLWFTEMAEVECFRALQLGARGILKKTLPVESIVDCLRSVAAGSVWLENAVSGQVTGFLGRRHAPRLTPREKEIVRCLCRGMRNKEIAQELAITPGTVKVHLMHIFEKTGVKDRFELAVHGRRLLGADDSDEQSMEQSVGLGR